MLFTSLATTSYDEKRQNSLMCWFVCLTTLFRVIYKVGLPTVCTFHRPKGTYFMKHAERLLQIYVQDSKPPLPGIMSRLYRLFTTIRWPVYFRQTYKLSYYTRRHARMLPQIQTSNHFILI